MANRKKRNEFSLGEAIELYLQEAHLVEKLRLSEVRVDFEIIVGKAIAEKIDRVWFRPQHQQFQCYLTISNPSWRNELLYSQEQIKNAINQYVGKEVCSGVFFD
jgi:hypothetical protein